MITLAFRVEKLLGDGKELTIQEIAAELGCHPGSLRPVMNRLTDKGIVERLAGHPSSYRVAELPTLDEWQPDETLISKLKVAYDSESEINISSYVKKHGYDKTIHLLKNMQVMIEREAVLKEFQ